jgi:hypothetical protein
MHVFPHITKFLPNLTYKYLKLSASNAVAVQFRVSPLPPPSPQSCIAAEIKSSMFL